MIRCKYCTHVVCSEGIDMIIHENECLTKIYLTKQGKCLPRS